MYIDICWGRSEPFLMMEASKWASITILYEGRNAECMQAEMNVLA